MNLPTAVSLVRPTSFDQAKHGVHLSPFVEMAHLEGDVVLLLRCPHPNEPQPPGADVDFYFFELDLELPKGQDSLFRVALQYIYFPLFSRNED